MAFTTEKNLPPEWAMNAAGLDVDQIKEWCRSSDYSRYKNIVMCTEEYLVWVRKGRFRTKVHRVSYPRIISAQFRDSDYYDYFEVLVSQEKHDDNLSIITRRRGGRRRAEGVMAFIRKSTHPEVEVEVTITQRYRKPGSRPWLPGASNS